MSPDKKPDKEPKDTGLHVDADWKAEAQAEKERLAEEAEKPAAEGGREPPPGAAREMPPPSFSVLLQSLASQALFFMSDERDPRTGRSIRNLELAKHNIDLMEVLDEKTRGNLNAKEKKELDTLLYQMRMAYVAATGH